MARLGQLAEDALKRCRSLGADQAEVGVNESSGLAVNVRMGEVETVEHTRDRGLSITVYVGGRKGSASTADLDPASIETSVLQAVAIARHTEPDPCAGLADPERMAREFPDLDLWHPWGVSADAAIELALACEAEGRGVDPRVSNSDGAAVSTGASLAVYANSHGFVGAERSTSHSISCSLIAGTGDGMQRDYWYSSACSAEDVEDPASIGRRAAERALRRLDPRGAPTGDFPILFAPEVARSLIGHLLSAASGGALYRRASFLLDACGQQILPAWMHVRERPHIARGARSANFDGEGVATVDSDLISAGVLARYVLGSYSARKLGLSSTGNAGGVHNLLVEGRGERFEDLLAGIPRGLLVTELMGQGVSTITGDYSRGAAGFWIENGEIAWPVDEFTIAGKLPEMYRSIEAVGADVDLRSHIRTGSILVGRMTVAGGGESS